MHVKYVEGQSNPVDVNITVVLFRYSRAFGDGFCNLNHGQITRMTPELPSSPNFHITPTPVDVVWKFGERLLAQMSSSSLGRGSLPTQPLCFFTVRHDLISKPD
ncbi:hypothetical protein TNCV_4403221 [Trichonephila clavipes]|uniref:Uncharacterized protein n=1 Tax=Trichonephila clavipes TaxID=2585209 RepID=A0A8X6S6P9_TRICX|nr:hypothetical protein TNCV_4403221 [Trichonephila clavipes]